MKCLTISFLVLFLTLSSAFPSEEILKGTFDGRSGDIILNSHPTDSSFVVFLPQNVALTESTLRDTEFADLVSHLMGTPALNPSASHQKFPQKNFFQNPAANLLFVLDTIPDVNNMPLLASHTKYGIRSSAYSVDTSSRLTTLLSGVVPSTHGIIGDKWFDRSTEQTVAALDSWNPETTGAQSASLQDVFTLFFEGESLVLSASASEQMTKLLSAKSFVLKDTRTSNNNMGFFWNRRTFQNVYLGQKSKFSMSTEVIRKTLLAEQSRLNDGANNNEVEQQCSGGFFDLDASKPEYDLLLEIGFIKALINALEYNVELSRLVKDDVRDFFSFGFSGFKKVVAAYGKDAPETVCAAHWIDRTIGETLARLVELYGGEEENILASVIVLDDLTPSSVEERINSALSSSPAKSDIAALLYPNLYLRRDLSLEGREQMCLQLQSLLVRENVEVECMPESEGALFAHQAYVLRAEENGVGETNDTSNPASTFQIVLWTSVGLGLTTLAAAYTMFTIDASTDMMLYHEDIKYLKYT